MYYSWKRCLCCYRTISTVVNHSFFQMISVKTNYRCQIQCVCGYLYSEGFQTKTFFSFSVIIVKSNIYQDNWFFFSPNQ